MLTVVVLTCTIAGIIYLLSYWTCQLRKFKDIDKLPGPSTLEIIWQILRKRNLYDKYQYAISLNKKYGPVVKFWIKPFDPIIVVADAEFFEKILVSKKHLEKSKLYDFIEFYLGESVGLTNNIDLWKKLRKITNMAFQPSNIAKFLEIFATHIDTLLDDLKNETGKVINAQLLVRLYLLDIIFETMTKQKQHFQENGNLTFFNARADFFRIIRNGMYSLFMGSNLLFKFQKDSQVLEKAMHTIKSFIRNIIRTEKMRREGEFIKNSTLHVIDTLFENELQNDALNSNMCMFLFAGYDTMLQATCFSLYELSKHPTVQQKLFEEITSVVGKDKYAEIKINDLNHMKYLESTVKEILRIRTIAPIIERKLGEDLNINDIRYPKGTIFRIYIEGVHKSEQYFKDPEKFDPDRFMPENAHLIQRNSFAPFSLGPRDCNGKLYAMLLLKFFVAKVIQKFEIEPVENCELKLVADLTIRSLTGIPVIFKERI